jgi:GlpG protein
MRQIGHLEDEASARTFGDFLYVQGVENEIEAEPSHGWAVWIHAEEDLERATQLLGEFRADPTQPQFHEKAAAAKQLRTQKEKEHAEFVRKSASGRQIVQTLHTNDFGVVPLILIVISAGVYLLMQLKQTSDSVNQWLYITRWMAEENYIKWIPGLPEIRHGQIWRLFTPMFLHFSFMHILFNMLWLRELGRMIEVRQGSLRLILLVLLTAAASNFGQYLQGGPMFGGMSGVVFGLFGYIWMKAKFTPWSGYVLHPNTVVMQLVWLVVCFTGLIGPVANTCHVVGLVVGVAWGWLSTLKRK